MLEEIRKILNTDVNLDNTVSCIMSIYNKNRDDTGFFVSTLLSDVYACLSNNKNLVDIGGKSSQIANLLKDKLTNTQE
jgi:hypothetical protein